jgi:hypothetical protein
MGFSFLGLPASASCSFRKCSGDPFGAAGRRAGRLSSNIPCSRSRLLPIHCSSRFLNLCMLFSWRLPSKFLRVSFPLNISESMDLLAVISNHGTRSSASSPETSSRTRTNDFATVSEHFCWRSKNRSQSSSVTFLKYELLCDQHLAGICPRKWVSSIPVVPFDVEHDLVNQFLL